MTDPRPLPDVDLLAWAVVLEYRDRQYARGSNIILLPYPPCPTCGENVDGVHTYQRRDQFESRITMKPCGHGHAVAEAQVDRIHRHIGDLLELLDTASRWPAGKGWNTERIIAEARTRVGQEEQAATEATEFECCCVCGGTPIVYYHNHLGLPLCRACADCRCGQNPCARTGVNDPEVSETAELERLRRTVRQLMTVNRRHADQLVTAHQVTIGDLRRAEAQVRAREAALARVEALAARIAAGHPVQDNADDLAAAIRDAARTDQPKETP
ncbi:hypothetical protein [Streptomyces prasinus]|uniref:hypothetical protein n=1 Tax=Streptomyces prasinus TaxID=67345 RepID=UPI00369B79ED